MNFTRKSLLSMVGDYLVFSWQEFVSKIESTIHVSAHYLMMVLTVLFVFIVYLLTRQHFPIVVIIVPTVFMFFRDMNKKQEEKKWMYFWLLFSFLTIFAKLFSRIKYFDIVKVAICYFFAFFDKEHYLEKGFEYIESGLKMAAEKYMSLCKEN